MSYNFAGLKYEGLTNLGDQIQSIAAEQFIPKINKRFNRDTLSSVRSRTKQFIILNGWFTHSPQNAFPPSPSIIPIFWGFHITDWNNSWDHFVSPSCLDYFREYTPIGCRDQFTASTLSKHGIDTFYSKCLTLTLPHRNSLPKYGFNIIVDVPFKLPQFITDKAIYATHHTSVSSSEEKKMQQATDLLKLYRDHARLIVTTRIHCALPCIAMGIPVIFFGDPSDYRSSIIKDTGLVIHELPKQSSNVDHTRYLAAIEKMHYTIDWDPNPLNFKNEKAQMIRDFKRFLKAQTAQYRT